jgi:predicted small metal-binding protein
MKSFACADVVPGCDARFLGTNDTEIQARVAVHAAAVHGLVTVPPGYASSVREHTFSFAA